jgi:cytoskeletal protein RodZ
MPRIVKLSLYLVYILIIVGLISAIALTFHDDHASAPGTPKVAQQKTPAKVAQIKAPATTTTTKSSSSSSNSSSSESKSPATNSSTASTTGTAATPTSSSQNASSATSSGSNLTNTGPGDTVLIFFLSSLLGSLIYRRRLTRRNF